MKLRERALNLLARREHSRAELARKLARFIEPDGDPDVFASEVAVLLDALERENLLSNARYAESLANTRAGKHGSLRLRADLLNKGVPGELVAETLSLARTQDMESARQVWHRKFPNPPTDAAERARQMRFLASRGFPVDVVRRVVGESNDDTT